MSKGITVGDMAFLDQRHAVGLPLEPYEYSKKLAGRLAYLYPNSSQQVLADLALCCILTAV